MRKEENEGKKEEREERRNEESYEVKLLEINKAK